MIYENASFAAGKEGTVSEGCLAHLKTNFKFKFESKLKVPSVYA